MKRSNCAPARVIFTNESSQGHGITYEWDFGNGTISHSSERILEEVYPDPGTYNIVLKVIEGTDTVMAAATVNIFKGPVAKFNADQTEGCVPFEVSFHHNSETGDASIKTVFWDFRDGITLVSDSPQHLYTRAGNFDVFIQITDSNGCTDYTETKGLITVYPEPEISFSASDTHACEPPMVVNFINNSVASTDLLYHWDLGNGMVSESYNATASYNVSGVYNVSLRSENELGCVSSLTKESYIVVGKPEGHIYAKQGIKIIEDENAILCPGMTRFNSTIKGSADYTWHVHYNGNEFIREGQEFTYLLTDSGRVEVKLVYGQHSACPDSMNISFRVDHISADFEMDPMTSCQLPVNVNLTDRSENQAAMKWILPDNSEDTASDISYMVSHTLSYEEIYHHTVNQLRFSFMHVATSINGCRDTVKKGLRVSLPVARFMPDRVAGCVPLEVTFSDSSRSFEPIHKWTYIINEDSFSQYAATPVVHTFQEPGEFEVMLVIENSVGCADTSYPITIKTGSRLKPDFTAIPEQVCFGDSIELVDKTMPNESIDFWHYTSPGLFNITVFNNFPPAIEVLPSTTGYKSIHLEVGHNGCVSDTVIQLAFYANSPAGSFHEIFACDSPLNYTFIPDIAMATSIEWTINDSVMAGMDSIRYNFPSAGDYIVTLKAFNNIASCLASITKTIKVRNVKADFITDPVVCYGDTVFFNAGLSEDYISECYNEGFLWDFDDLTPRRRTFREKFPHVFYDTGTFVTKLIVRADNGCEDTLQQNIKVVLPRVNFSTSVNEGCTSGLVVMFTKTSTDTLPVTWEWIFGDNITNGESVSPVNHRYTSESSRIYWAGLVVRDKYGCRNDKYVPITLSEPDISFNADNNFVCTGNRVNFSAPYGEYDSFLWDFGDGTTSMVSHDHVYAEAGIYDVTLSASQNGCQDTMQKAQYINVEKADAGYSVNDSVFDCYPAQVLFSYSAGSNVAEGIWTFGDGVQSPGYRDNYQYTYSRPGTYNTALWIRTPNNCQATRSKAIIVTGPYATFDFEPRSICYGDPVAFSLISSQNVSEMKWIFGDGETSTSTAPVHNYKAKGVIHPALLVKHNACEVTLTFATLNVSSVTAAFDFPDGRTSFCLNEKLQTINQSTGYQNVTWSVDDTLTIREPTITSLLLSSEGSMQIGLAVTDATGCTDSLKKGITITPLPDFVIKGDALICSGKASSLFIDPANPDWNVLWYPPEGLNDPTSLTPLLTIDSTRYYTALITDENGCQSLRDITIRVEQLPLISRIPLQDTSIFIGESIELSIESDNPAALYSWGPDYRISCMTCNQPIVTPEDNVVYNVTVSDECFTITEQFPVEVIIDFYIETPDAFSPNGDNNNDIFMPETKNIREIKEFKIFNRWGNLVFETTRLDEGWDGTVNGKIQHMDTYAFYIRAVTSHGYETEKRGNFILMK